MREFGEGAGGGYYGVAALEGEGCDGGAEAGGAACYEPDFWRGGGGGGGGHIVVFKWGCLSGWVNT